MASLDYTGSHLFMPLSKSTGIPIDQLNFVVVESSGILFGFLLRLALPHSLNKPTLRLLYCLALGVGFLLFLIGKSTWVVLLQIIVCYAVMKYFPQRHMQVIVFILALGYLLLLYVIRVSQNLVVVCYDETYPLMVTTQKITTLAFGLSDWRLMQRCKKLGAEREKWAVRELPGLLEYLAFTLSFQGVLAGPFCHYNLFSAFIEGNTKARLSNEAKCSLRYEDDPSTCVRAVMSKVSAVAVWTYITAWVQPLYPETINADPVFIASHGYLYRTLHVYFCLFLRRAKYYVTWILSDAVYNASGLGYVGTDEKGRPQWTGMSNVFVHKLETAPSFKIYLDNWNIMTTHWLRHVCYNRAPFMNTLLTFILSALWHGVHPGYYLTFVAAAFFVEAGRKFRANIRPLFQGSRASRFVYDVITTLATQLSLPFLVFSFVVRDLQLIFRFHMSFYFAVYVIVAFSCFALPRKKRSPLPPSSKSPSPTKELTEAGDGKVNHDSSSPQQQLQQRQNGNNNSHHMDGTGVSRDQRPDLEEKLKRRGGESVQQA